MLMTGKEYLESIRDGRVICIGSERVADQTSRATSYEKFFVGPAFAVRNYNFVNAPWDELHGMVEDFLGSYGTGQTKDAVSAAAE